MVDKKFNVTTEWEMGNCGSNPFILGVLLNFLLNFMSLFANLFAIVAAHRAKVISKNLRVLLISSFIGGGLANVDMLLKCMWYLLAVVRTNYTSCYFTLFECNLSEMVLFIGSLAMFLSLLSIIIDRSMKLHRVIKTRNPSETDSKRICGLLLSVCWMIPIVIAIYRIQSAWSQRENDSNPIFIWCSISTSFADRILGSIYGLLLFINETSCIVLFEITFKKNRKVYETFNRQGVAQDLDMRMSLKETMNLTNGLKYSLRAHFTFVLAIMVWSLIFAHFYSDIHFLLVYQQLFLSCYLLFSPLSFLVFFKPIRVKFCEIFKRNSAIGIEPISGAVQYVGNNKSNAVLVNVVAAGQSINPSIDAKADQNSQRYFESLAADWTVKYKNSAFQKN